MSAAHLRSNTSHRWSGAEPARRCNALPPVCTTRHPVRKEQCIIRLDVQIYGVSLAPRSVVVSASLNIRSHCCPPDLSVGMPVALTRFGRETESAGSEQAPRSSPHCGERLASCWVKCDGVCRRVGIGFIQFPCPLRSNDDRPLAVAMTIAPDATVGVSLRIGAAPERRQCASMDAPPTPRRTAHEDRSSRPSLRKRAT
jgi:hypothetical protein